jgi:hypothetical protein
VEFHGVLKEIELQKNVSVLEQKVLGLIWNEIAQAMDMKTMILNSTTL